jgi:hypothetical protein
MLPNFKKQGGLGDMKKRMLMAKWASEAWTELTETEHHLLRSAFVQTGFLVAKDGSENHPIELHKTNFPAGTYSF